MKKKYIQYRSGLFIGLLSLSTLSSCVNTRQGLGMDGSTSSRQAKQGGKQDNSTQTTKQTNNWDTKKAGYAVLAVAVGTAALGGSAGAGYYAGNAKGYDKGYKDGLANRSSNNSNSSHLTQAQLGVDASNRNRSYSWKTKGNIDLGNPYDQKRRK